MKNIISIGHHNVSPLINNVPTEKTIKSHQKEIVKDFKLLERNHIYYPTKGSKYHK